VIRRLPGWGGIAVQVTAKAAWATAPLATVTRTGFAPCSEQLAAMPWSRTWCSAALTLGRDRVALAPIGCAEPLSTATV